ncbi:hypothetical protein MELB17_18224 [Marinobacter sp. ELB17]|nr:hypothetical protein [Marinobacter sp. ELB17]EBA01016.1 hypothetical protein MELB17_18224 [Marinobacter sp. ELB17]
MREDKTDGHYRLWSINDDHPAMIRTVEPNSKVELEVWKLPLAAGTSPNTTSGFHPLPLTL